MRIGQLVESGELGGAEMMIVTLGAELRARGHEVAVMGPAGRDAWLSSASRSRELDYHPFTANGPFDLRGLRALARQLRESRVDVLHCHMFAASVFGAALGRLLSIPTICTLHTGAEQTSVWRRRAALRWALRQHHASTAVSARMKSDLLSELGSAAAAMLVIPNGMPTPSGERSHVRKELGIRDDEVVVLALGSCVVRKNHVDLVRALGRDRARPWRLVIAGREDDGTPDILQAAAALSVTDRIHLLGVRNDVDNLLAASDVYAMPSTWEGMPLALIQGMLAGLPCVVTDVGGMPEMIEDGVSGHIVALHDVDALAAALNGLIDDPSRRASYGARAREVSLHRYGARQMSDTFLTLYAAAIG